MLTEDFLNYLRWEKNRSPQTVSSYAEDLSIFEAYFSKLDCQLTWETVDADVIRGWMEDMMDRGNSAATVCRRLSALRTLYRYAIAHRRVSHNPTALVRGPKKSKPLPQFLKESEVDVMLDSPEWGDDFESVRARAILMTFYETGIRLSELTGLDDSSIDWADRSLKVLGKRDKQRIIPFGEELHDEILRYTGVRDGQTARADDALFVTRRGERMSRGQVRGVVRKYLSRYCTLKKLSPHVLRHTFATAMLNHDAGLESVRKLLGHESLSTTEIYTHTTFEQLKRVYKNAHPRA